MMSYIMIKQWNNKTNDNNNDKILNNIFLITFFIAIIHNITLRNLQSNIPFLYIRMM